MRTVACVAVLVVIASCTTSPVQHFKAEGALGPYSAAVVAGDLCFLSGKIGSERSGSFSEEASSSLDAVEAELQRHGLGFADVVVAQVFLTDIRNYAAFNEVYAARLPAPYPARACVAVKELPGNARVEVMVTAVR